MKAKKKLACLFPGSGYTCDKPLLYYSRNLLQKMGWEVVCVPYSGFPAGVKGNTVKQEQCVAMAAEQAEAMLKKIPEDAFVVALCIEGVLTSSEELSALLGIRRAGAETILRELAGAGLVSVREMEGEKTWRLKS